MWSKSRSLPLKVAWLERMLYLQNVKSSYDFSITMLLSVLFASPSLFFSILKRTTFDAFQPTEQRQEFLGYLTKNEQN